MRWGLLSAVLFALMCPGAASAATASQAVASLNGQRAANGIPAGITEDASASSACAAHNNYERLNGDVLTHFEVPGKPGYSQAGANAAKTSVLAGGSNWNGADPFNSAPIHLAQLLDPALDRMGINDSGGLVCATTLPPVAGFRAGPPAPTAYSYPGNGRTGWSTSEQASEGPFTPGDLLGLRQPKVTGPYLYVLFTGPWLNPFAARVKLTSASVDGPSGPVPIKIADGTLSTPGGIPLGAYIGPEAMVIPVSPLATGTKYAVSMSGQITAGGASWPVSEQFSFTTGGSGSGQPSVSLGHPSHKHGGLQFALTASGAYIGHKATVEVKLEGKVVRRWSVKLKSRRTISLKRYRHATLIVSVPGSRGLRGVKLQRSG